MAAGACGATTTPQGGSPGLAVAAAPGPAEPADTSVRLPEGEPRGTSVALCTETVTEHELHKCVVEITAEEARRREVYYAVYSRNGRFVGYELKSGRALAGKNTSQCKSWDYFLEDSPATVVCRDQNGVVRRRDVMSPDRALYLRRRGAGQPDFTEGTRTSGLRREHDARGRVSAYYRIEPDGELAVGKDGVTLVRPVRNAAGGLVEESYYDASGTPVVDTDGVHRVVYGKDGRGWTVRQAHFGVQSEPVLNSDGVHVITILLDDVGNELERRFYGLRGEPVLRKDGTAGWRVERNDYGEVTLYTGLGLDGQPTEAYGYVHRRQYRDAHGRITEYAHFDADWRPVVRKEGHSSLRYTYDARGNVIEERLFDAAGRPLRGRQYRNTYDERDNLIRLDYLELGDVRPGTYVASTYAYDSGDNLMETTFVDRDGNPAEGPGGYAWEVIERRADGSPSATRYYAADGREIELFAYRSVLIPYGPERSRDEALRLAERVQERVRAGQPLEAAARQLVSSQVVFESVPRTRFEKLPSGVAAVLPGLEVGAVSEPIDTGVGLQLLQRAATRP